MIILYFIGRYEWGLYIGAAVIGFNFGGNFALFPAGIACLAMSTLASRLKPPLVSKINNS